MNKCIELLTDNFKQTGSVKINEKELTDAAKEEIRRNVIYNEEGDFRSSLVAGHFRYRVSSDKLYLNQSAAGSLCQNRSSKLAEIKTEFEKNVVKLLLRETTARSKWIFLRQT